MPTTAADEGYFQATGNDLMKMHSVRLSNRFASTHASIDREKRLSKRPEEDQNDGPWRHAICTKQHDHGDPGQDMAKGIGSGHRP